MNETVEVQGVSVPRFMYGTAWKEDRTTRLTQLALQSGFTAIDTANQRKHYFEQAVGDGVAAHMAKTSVAREALFLQTKFTYRRGQDHRLPYDPGASPAEQVAQSFASSLEHLRTSYLDSYVLHGPETRHGITDVDWEVWRAMEAQHAAGTTKLIGVSNISQVQLHELYDGATVKPAFVQNRCYARTGWDREVRTFCTDNGIAYQGFSLLTANDRELHERAVVEIAERHGRTIPQVVFRFAMHVGMIPLTGTSNASHMEQDLACVEFDLDDAEIERIETISG
jgi:diketogulonate reductase-like aldo/keto reductase